jgi:hypothetical protein
MPLGESNAELMGGGTAVKPRRLDIIKETDKRLLQMHVSGNFDPASNVEMTQPP